MDLPMGSVVIRVRRYLGLFGKDEEQEPLRVFSIRVYMRNHYFRFCRTCDILPMRLEGHRLATCSGIDCDIVALFDEGYIPDEKKLARWR